MLLVMQQEEHPACIIMLQKSNGSLLGAGLNKL